MTPTDAQHPGGAAGVPPILPPPLPGTAFPRPKPAQQFSPLLIAAILAGVLMMLLGVGAVATVLVLRSQRANEAQARAQRMAADARAAESQRRQGAPRDSAVAPTTQARPVKSEPGVSYHNDRIRTGPWSIHVIKVDRAQKDLGFYSAHAQGTVLGVAVLADQARAIPRDIGRAIAAVNGDFYERDNRLYAGDPRGLQIVQGELLSAPHTVCVWFDPEGNPHLDEVKGDFHVQWPDGSRISFGLNQRRLPDTAVLYTPSYGPAFGPTTRSQGGRELVLEKDGTGPWLPLAAGQAYKARVREIRTEGNTPIAPDTVVLSIGPELLSSVPKLDPGAVLSLSTATTPDLKGAPAAIAGGPAIIKDGQPFSMSTPPPGLGNNYSERSKYERHPRSAIGWSKSHIYLVTVDGRQPGLSVGMKLAELAEYMVGLGCTDAMNFDGGKSAQMWLSGRIVNSPAQGEDTVANSLMVIRKPTAP